MAATYAEVEESEMDKLAARADVEQAAEELAAFEEAALHAEGLTPRLGAVQEP